MINANEIMIGCFVKYNDGGYFKVTGIHEFGLDVEDEIETTYMEFDNFSPIHITEEILVKAGFIRGSVTMYFLPIPKLNCEIHATWFHNQYVIELQNNRIPIVAEVKYLHQLQMLYFSLTGQHLNIKI